MDSCWVGARYGAGALPGTWCVVTGYPDPGLRADAGVERVLLQAEPTALHAPGARRNLQRLKLPARSAMKVALPQTKES